MSHDRPLSPLRYPGGKAILADYLYRLIEHNGIEDCIYAEPFAGGAGAAVQLLLEGKVRKLLLNDADRSIWAFWKSITEQHEAFIDLLERTPVNVSTWRTQRAIYFSPKEHTRLQLGFAAFFLNRCNRSGVIKNGGVIGGLKQAGVWKIDARFNKPEQIRRIRAIAAKASAIEISNFDALKFLKKRILSERNRSKILVYLDPPYFDKGSRLYLNYYRPGDHASLANYLSRVRRLKWLVSYDNAPPIRALYSSWSHTIDFNLHYSAHSSRIGSEIMIFSKELSRPNNVIQLRSA